jgi:squalene-hopene/tetraprenyl-beta-curcumene cyclase
VTGPLEDALSAARAALLAARAPSGHWEGELSSSALSTATAVVALELVGGHTELVRRGREWLGAHANADGGYGDTVDSPSNLSTTSLVWAATGSLKAETWLRRELPDLSAESIASTLERRYGIDRTFSVPILTLLALTRRVPWDAVPSLPFELAALPRSWFGALGLPVVSYALPALIAVGLVRHVNAPSRNPFARLARGATKGRTLRVLEAVQPSSGGFLEATPLTSFVAMSLAGAGRADHAVTKRAVAFLEKSVRPDGSWAIDTNLATWVTTLSVNALGDALPKADRPPIRAWLLAQQTKSVHAYTRAAPGAWAWTDLPGGVPDADDTPGALLALAKLRDGADPELVAAAKAGCRWLVDLQNRDGGIPTFCRGWGTLPFDRSCPDLTAHALRAWSAWKSELPWLSTPIALGERYLAASQQGDGSWIPLWFGNQRAPMQENPVYGTSRVLLHAGTHGDWILARKRGFEWLRDAQNPDGGWGGAPGIPSSIEETALAVEALAPQHGPEVRKGVQWLVDRTAGGTQFPPSPIGLYFAKLWYWERLYPMIFTTAALGAADRA